MRFVSITLAAAASAALVACGSPTSRGDAGVVADGGGVPSDGGGSVVTDGGGEDAGHAPFVQPDAGCLPGDGFDCTLTPCCPGYVCRDADGVCVPDVLLDGGGCVPIQGTCGGGPPCCNGGTCYEGLCWAVSPAADGGTSSPGDSGSGDACLPEGEGCRGVAARCCGGLTCMGVCVNACDGGSCDAGGCGGDSDCAADQFCCPWQGGACSPADGGCASPSGYKCATPTDAGVCPSMNYP